MATKKGIIDDVKKFGNRTEVFVDGRRFSGFGIKRVRSGDNVKIVYNTIDKDGRVFYNIETLSFIDEEDEVDANEERNYESKKSYEPGNNARETEEMASGGTQNKTKDINRAVALKCAVEFYTNRSIAINDVQEVYNTVTDCAEGFEKWLNRKTTKEE